MTPKPPIEGTIIAYDRSSPLPPSAFLRPAHARQSPAGKISFVCGLFAVLSLCSWLIAVKAGPGSSSVRVTGIMMVAAVVAVLLLGLVTGILGVLPPRRKRALA